MCHAMNSKGQFCRRRTAWTIREKVRTCVGIQEEFYTGFCVLHDRILRQNGGIEIARPHHTDTAGMPLVRTYVTLVKEES